LARVFKKFFSKKHLSAFFVAALVSIPRITVNHTDSRGEKFEKVLRSEKGDCELEVAFSKNFEYNYKI